jgi:hypothetical protein
MFDVFTEQIEVLIKDGIANLYWYKDDLQKAWLRCGVSTILTQHISAERDIDGNTLSKRKQMDRLYQELRSKDFDKRLEVSRNFVRILVEHSNFVPQDPRHRIDVAERSALKLRELIRSQQAEREEKDRARRQTAAAPKKTYHQELEVVREAFEKAHALSGQEKGYALEKIFVDLMQVSAIPVQEPFHIVGEQLDGAIKHDGHYYLVELKWFAEPLEPKHIGSFYFKVDGKLGARGIVIAMNGYTSGVIESVAKGKELKVLLLDGMHLSHVIYARYTFKELLDHAVKCASLKGQLYCPHALS